MCGTDICTLGLKSGQVEFLYIFKCFEHINGVYLYGGVYAYFSFYHIVAKWSNSFSVCYICSYYSEPPRWLVSPTTLYFIISPTGMLLLCSFLLGQNSRQSTELTGKSTTVFVTMDGKLISCRLYIYHVSYQLWRRKLLKVGGGALKLK